MKRSHFSEEQIIVSLKDHRAGLGAKELFRKHGIRDATSYKWRSKYGSIEMSDARPLKTVESENAKLKKMVDVATGYKQRRACALAGIDPRVYRLRSKRSADAELRTRMKELASKRRWFGYRRLHVLLKRES